MSMLQRTGSRLIAIMAVSVMILALVTVVHPGSAIAKPKVDIPLKPYIEMRGDAEGLGGYKFKNYNFQDYEDNEYYDLHGNPLNFSSSYDSAQERKTRIIRILNLFILYHYIFVSR